MTRKEFLRKLITMNLTAEEETVLLFEFEVDNEVLIEAKTKSSEASKKYYSTKTSVNNRCKCGSLIAIDSHTCRDCIDNGIHRTHYGVRQLRTRKLDLMDTHYYQGGLVSPR